MFESKIIYRQQHAFNILCYNNNMNFSIVRFVLLFVNETYLYDVSIHLYDTHTYAIHILSIEFYAVELLRTFFGYFGFNFLFMNDIYCTLSIGRRFVRSFLFFLFALLCWFHFRSFNLLEYAYYSNVIDIYIYIYVVK